MSQFNSPIRILLSAAIWLLTAAIVSAEDAPTPILRVETQIYQVPQARAIALIPRLSDPSTALAAFAELQSDVEQARAQLLSTLIGAAGPGGETEATQREELRYAIEFEIADPRLVPPSPPGHPLSVPYPVTTFETRDLGPKLHLKWEDQKDFPYFQIDAGAVRLDGWDRFESEILANGTHLYTAQPILCSRRSVAVPPLCSGQPILTGAYALPEKPGFFELHLLTSHVRRFDRPNPLPAAPPPPWVRVEMQRFRLPQSDALALRSRLLDPTQIDAAFAELLDLVARDRVELRAWATVPTTQNQRASIENFRERRYVIETDANPNGFTTPSRDLTYDGLDELEGNAIPVGIESRNIGETMEVEPGVSEDGQAVSLQISTTSVQLEGFQRQASGPNFAGTYGYFYTPKFKTRKTSTTLTLANGERSLFEFTRLLNASGQCELVLLHATTGPSDSSPPAAGGAPLPK